MNEMNFWKVKVKQYISFSLKSENGSFNNDRF